MEHALIEAVGGGKQPEDWFDDNTRPPGFYAFRHKGGKLMVAEWLVGYGSAKVNKWSVARFNDRATYADWVFEGPITVAGDGAAPAVQPAQAERLHLLIEDCAAVISAATKALHYGMGNHDPIYGSGGSTCEQTLDHRLLDLHAAVTMMHRCGDFDDVVDEGPRGTSTDQRIRYKLAFTKHQAGEYRLMLGTLAKAVEGGKVHDTAAITHQGAAEWAVPGNRANVVRMPAGHWVLAVVDERLVVVSVRTYDTRQKAIEAIKQGTATPAAETTDDKGEANG